jgi:hypothetical protein
MVRFLPVRGFEDVSVRGAAFVLAGVQCQDLDRTSQMRADCTCCSDLLLCECRRRCRM